MQRSYSRGWPIEWNGKLWVYSDNKMICDDSRPCRRCGRMPTAEGYDACLGKIEGATSACCGHGVEDGSVMMTSLPGVRFVEAGGRVWDNGKLLNPREITGMLNELDRSQKLIRHMRKMRRLTERKIEHGCIGMSCKICQEWFEEVNASGELPNGAERETDK